MARVITFSTDLFDISAEEPNPINPIAGQAVLDWLRARLEGSGYATTKPATEDWGWYIDVTGAGTSYLVGASGEPERPPPDMDWTLQIHRHRTLTDKLTGRNRMTPIDPLALLIEAILRDEPAFRDVVVDDE
jgi:hypothetical protein